MCFKGWVVYMADKQDEHMISPGNHTGHKMKVCKILGYSGHYRSSALSRSKKVQEKKIRRVDLSCSLSLRIPLSISLSLFFSLSVLPSFLPSSSLFSCSLIQLLHSLSPSSQMLRWKTWENCKSLHKSASTWKTAHLVNILFPTYNFGRFDTS